MGKRRFFARELLLLFGQLLPIFATPVNAAEPDTFSRSALVAAESFRAAGRLQRADRELVTALERSKTTASSDVFVDVLRWRLAVVRSAQGRFDEALRLYEKIEVAHFQRQPDQLAALYNDRGVLYGQLENYAQALIDIGEAFRLAKQANDSVLQAQASINKLRVQFEDSRLQEVVDGIPRARMLLGTLADPDQQAYLNLALADIIARSISRFGLGPTQRLLAYELTRDAAKYYTATDNPARAAFAIGTLGELYEEERRYTESLALARRAIVLAQQDPITSRSFRWHWLSARALSKIGDAGAALQSYASAVDALRSIRSDLEIGERNVFRRIVSPLFREYADQLLQANNSMPAASGGDSLSLARSLLEELKQVEVRDYFQDACLPLAPQRVVVDRAKFPDTAVLYPMVFANRVELLLSVNGQLQSSAIPVNRSELLRTISAFRRSIQVNTGTREYLQSGQQLYDWLIRPVVAELRRKRIQTLVVVPDAALRSIPVAALWDGHAFLLSEFAVATVPSLELFDPIPIEPNSFAVLAAGLSDKSQAPAFSGLPALSNVESEIKYLVKKFNATSLLNEKFLVDEVSREVGDDTFRIVHLATHGKFGGTYGESYIVGWDGPLSIDRLANSIAKRQLGDDTLELLVLSACETAAGDERSALGLAGVSLRAGARSAMGSLWSVNDPATAILVKEFYERLSAGRSKAESLRQAQLELMKNPKYAHPSVWAPFLLIGNWL